MVGFTTTPAKEPTFSKIVALGNSFSYNVHTSIEAAANLANPPLENYATTKMHKLIGEALYKTIKNVK